MKRYEYAVRCKGEAFGRGRKLNVLGYVDGVYYFDNEDERSDFIDSLRDIAMDFSSVEFEGYLTRYQILARVVLDYNGMKFTCVQEFEPYYTMTDIEDNFTRGPLSDDVSKAELISAYYPSVRALLDDPVTAVGIKLVSLDFEFKKVPVQIDKNNILDSYICTKKLSISETITIDRSDIIYRQTDDKFYLATCGMRLIEIGNICSDALNEYFTILPR